MLGINCYLSKVYWANGLTYWPKYTYPIKNYSQIKIIFSNFNLSFTNTLKIKTLEEEKLETWPSLALLVWNATITFSVDRCMNSNFDNNSIVVLVWTNYCCSPFPSLPIHSQPRRRHPHYNTTTTGRGLPLSTNPNPVVVPPHTIIKHLRFAPTSFLHACLDSCMFGIAKIGPKIGSS